MRTDTNESNSHSKADTEAHSSTLCLVKTRALVFPDAPVTLYRPVGVSLWQARQTPLPLSWHQAPEPQHLVGLCTELLRNQTSGAVTNGVDASA